jgi:hypothetical protein
MPVAPPVITAVFPFSLVMSGILGCVAGKREKCLPEDNYGVLIT